ncbi:MAG: hypothetical protein E6R04_09895 [Spirochaetes bacterium]|nr:MAG: hypothetical protein E6R04_09895 [Spirochaetota bacterium]
MSHNYFAEKQEVQDNLIRAVDKLEGQMSAITLAISSPNQTYLTENSFQLLTKLLLPSNPWERMLYQELVQKCYQLEMRCQGSSPMFLRAFAAAAREITRKQGSYRELVEDNQKSNQRYSQEILPHCYPSSPSSIKEEIQRACQNLSIPATAVEEAIRLAGVEGNIVLAEEEVPSVLVELQFGYNFSMNPFKGFIPTNGTWTRAETKIMLVDGMLESVSEIDKLLNGCYSSKIPVILIAQGFSEEVVATLHANYSRGSLDVFPLRTQQNLEAINIMNDIAVVSGTDVISTLKGERLGTVGLDSLGSVEKASITGNVLTIHNSRTRGNVLSHLGYLEKRRVEQAETSQVSDLADLTSKRIQNLLAHLVKVTIPKGDVNRFRGIIDNAIRACRTSITYGYCKPLEINLERLEPMWRKAHLGAIKNLEGEKVSSVGLWLSVRMGVELATAYFTAAGALVRN